jgi:hypothetical protein
MYLAALVGQNLYVSTYFSAILDPVGGGGTHKNAHVKNAGKKAKATNFNRWRDQSTIVHPISPASHTLL